MLVTHGRGVGWGGQAYRQKYILAIAKAKAKLAILAKNQSSELLSESSLVRIRFLGLTEIHFLTVSSKY
jgi:hypothetical protein